MSLRRLPLGDYIQLLMKHRLLVSSAPLSVNLTRTVELVSCDSRFVVPGTLFLCKGVQFKESFLTAALDKGAFLYLSETVYPNVPAPCLQVTDVRRAMALLADLYYDHPSGKLRLVGLTGTKGKSSTAFFLKAILDNYLETKNGSLSGIISSITTFDGVECVPSHLTTPEPLDLARHLHTAASAGIEYLTMEVSSQALKYDRVYGVNFSAAVFLNIGNDHISPREHPNFEDYFASKLRIFSQSSIACVNLDMERVSDVLAAAQACSRVITFSCENPTADIYASQVEKIGHETVFFVRTPRFSRQLRLPVPGLFNISNALAAIAVCEAFDIPEAHIALGLSHAFVPGRMELYRSADGRIHAIVDYAHNGMSLEALLKTARAEYPDRRLLTLFGATGGKGLDRRKDMGLVAGALADELILTEDDPGPEDVEDICREIAHWASVSGNPPITVIPDRDDAVQEGIARCDDGKTLLLVAGKGCESEQKRKNGAVPCPTDGERVLAALARYDAIHPTV